MSSSTKHFIQSPHDVTSDQPCRTIHGFKVDNFLLSIKQRYPRSKGKRLNKGMAVHPRQPMMDRIKRGNEKHVDITAPIMQRSDHVHSRIASWV
jgi:hypothetical protein